MGDGYGGDVVNDAGGSAIAEVTAMTKSLMKTTMTTLI